MQSDTSLIQFDGELVILPLSVYLEIQASLRVHGETDLPLPIPTAPLVVAATHTDSTPTDNFFATGVE